MSGSSYQPPGADRPHSPSPRRSGVWILTRQGARALDDACINGLGMPSAVLMENAARSVADEVPHLAEPGASVCICCGAGNNGGDGFALARHLANAGYTVHIRTPGPFDEDRLSPETAMNLGVCRAMNLPVHTSDFKDSAAGFDLLVDALLGTGATSPPRDGYAAAVAWMNASGRPILAVDVPSGLDCDSGRPFDPDCCIKATLTVSLAGVKEGYLTLEAQAFLGDLAVGDIGAPEYLLERFARWMPAELVADEPEPDPAPKPKPRAEPRGRSRRTSV